MWDLIVIGGGAAGLWAAGTAAARGKTVLVLEKNRKPGVKILMSGGTRCNITHHCDIDGILDAFGRQGRFLKPALYELPPATLVAEMNRQGVATKVESSGKVFPVSNRAIDVRNALVKRLESAGARLDTGIAVLDVSPAEQSSWYVQIDSERLSAKKVLVCCGGLSYSGCGTTGDGYAWAERAGHTLVDTFPALTPLLSPSPWVHELTGITLPDVEARVLTGDKKSKEPRLSSRGSFLWTHFGCSGPVPMNVSRFVAASPQPHKTSLQLDLVPTQSERAIGEQFDASKAGRQRVTTLLQTYLPRQLAACLMRRAGVEEIATLSELRRAARRRLLEDLKRLCVPLSGTRGYAKAEVTQGGVNTREVNPHTLESRLAPGLFFAGEILDIDGPIGGYNFQAAFSTGHVAGLHV